MLASGKGAVIYIFLDITMDGSSRAIFMDSIERNVPAKVCTEHHIVRNMAETTNSTPSPWQNPRVRKKACSQVTPVLAHQLISGTFMSPAIRIE